MPTASWFRRWTTRTTRRPAPIERPARRLVIRPRLEVLEDRVQPSTLTWINPAGGDWNTPGNWNGGTVPGPTDDVSINSASVTLSTNVAVHNLTLNGTLAGPGNLTVTGQFSEQASTLAGTGTVYLDGASYVGLSLTLDRTLVNAGAFHLDGSLGAGPGVTITNLPGATFLLQWQGWGPGTMQVGTQGVPAAFTNEGSVVKAANSFGGPATPVIVNMAFDNGPTGSVHLESGGLTLAGGTSSGAFVGDPGTDIDFAGGFTFAAQTPAAPNSSITADNVSADNGNTLAIACPYVVHGSTSISYGSVFRFTGPVDVAGSDWLNFANFGGTTDFTAATLLSPLTFRNVVGGQQTTVLSNADVHVTGTYSGGNSIVTLGGTGTVYLDGGTAADPNTIGNALTLDRPLVNNGYTRAGSVNVWLGSGATVTNAAGATWESQDNGAVVPLAGATGTGFVNDGTLLRTSTVYPARYNHIDVPFTNGPTGTVHVAADTLAFGPLVDATGGRIVGDPGTTLSLNGPLSTMLGGLGGITSDHALSGDSINIESSFSVTLATGYSSQVGNQLTVIGASSSLSGTFAGLPEGATIAVAGYQFGISYANGDVTLTTLAVPYHSTTTSLVMSAKSPLFGDTVTFTATVRTDPGAGTPTGTVQFQVDGANLGSPVPLVNSVASLSTAALPVGAHTVTAVYTGANGFLASQSAAAVTVLAPSLIQGLVWVDVNNDGQVDFGEKAIAGVTVTLTGTDDLGHAVSQTAQTDANGIYAFTNLRPSNAAGYTITETQPAGFLQGQDALGTVNGTPTGSAAVQDVSAGVVLPTGGSVGENYNFGERPATTGAVGTGQTATIGFWQNKNGQNLLLALNGGGSSTQLGHWLATTFPNMYGSLDGETNTQVAAFYKALFARTAQTGPGGPPKVDAQVLATAFAVYVTNQSLAGNTAAAYGFQVTTYGVGERTFNVGSDGAAFGVANNANVSVLDLLLAADARSHNGLLYDQNGDGRIDSSEAGYRTMANDIFSAINEAGGL
jgi:hypothetical protein